MAQGKTNILIVDNDPVNIQKIEGDLQGGLYHHDFCRSGEDAHAFLSRDGHGVDVVLLDRQMLGINGFDLLMEMRKSPALRHIPVIIQSAQPEKKEIIKGVKAGVFYYLTKPFTREELLSVVQTATKGRQQYREIQALLDETYHSFKLLSSGSFQFRTVKDAIALSGLISRNYPNPKKVVTGLRELFLNAVEHGNLEITYDEKTLLNGTFALQEEVERRLALPEYKDKVVSVDLVTTETEITVTICDQGKGFDWQKYMEVSPDRVMDNHGRGIAMANLMSFDSVTYKGCGNCVAAVVKV
jgi:CheY-like chemotaxis protein/anti-sigma regulatory factor (Ser/Thr protein kinase)